MDRVVSLRHPSTHAVRFLTPRPLRSTPELSPSAILFDLDGTLVETMDTYADLAAEIVSRRYGLDPRNARRLYIQTSGLPFFQQLDVLFGDLAENEACAAEFEARKASVAREARMDESTRTTLEMLKDAGCRLVVSSSGMQDHVERFAGRTPRLFDLALGFGGGLSKGERHVATVCAELGLEREELLFVGDSLRDGDLAAAAGVDFVGRAGTFSRRDFARQFPSSFVIDEVEEILDLV